MVGNSVKFSCLGEMARRLLSDAFKIRIMGVTSRGLFLNIDHHSVLFLTGEPYRGPLSLNLVKQLPELRQMRVGDEIAVHQDGLWFPESLLHISFEGIETWLPPVPAANPLKSDERRKNIAWILERRPPISHLLPKVELQRLGQAVGAGQNHIVVDILKPIIGCGVGLTPEGDDFALGLLLTLNRWRSLFSPNLKLTWINSQLVDFARSHTTMLSASLISCVAKSQADERLIQALDGLVTGKPKTATCARLFQEWGSTSGWAAFQGMALVVSAVA